MSKTAVFIVEDEGIVAADLVFKLEQLGYEIAGTAQSGEEAIELVSCGRTDLVLMDIWLKGGMDGIEAAEAIGRIHDVPVVYLTAHSDPVTLDRAKLSGPFGYILKPFEQRELATQIEMALYRHQTDRKLREQREWFRVTLESIGDAVIATDAEGRISFTNAVADSLAGWGSEEVIGQPIQSVFHVVNEYTGEPLDEPVSRVLREKKAVALANHAALVCKNGCTVPIEDSAAPILDASGRMIGVVLVFHDVADKRRSEEALQESAARLRRIAQAGRIGFFEWNAAKDTAYWSPEHYDLFGYDPGSTVSWQQWFQGIHPEDRDRVAANTSQLLERSRAEGLVRGHKDEYRFFRPDGLLVWLESDLSVNIVAGEQIVSGSVRDVSKRKRAEEALRESEQRYRGIVETAKEGIATHEPDGTITYVNQRMADMLGCSRDEIIGKSSFDFLNDEDREELIRARESMEARGSFNKEWELRRKDGSMLWTLSSISPRRDSGGKFMGYLAMHTDITELKKAEQQLRDLNERLEQRVEQRTIKLEHQAAQLRQLTTELALSEQKERRRLAMILHDGLQQTLVAAKFGLALLERSGDARQKTADVAGLIDDCIEISRSLTAELSPPILYKGGLLPALEWLAKWMGDKHGLTVKLASRKPSERAPDQLDVLLFQSVRELLFNVVKHAGVRLAYVDVSESGGCIEVEVADDGAGFDVSQIQSREDKYTGMGLFSISERLSYLGGSLKIDSAPGKGSRFSLFMPLIRFPEQRIEASPELQSNVSFATIAHKHTDKDDGVRKIRIALVDDHMVMRQGLSGLLQVEPDMKIVGEASDGESAIALVREVRPDVVLMDIGMPGMDGIEATRRIHEQMPEVKIIGLSMLQEGNQAASILSAGAVAYLTKTGPSEAVLEAIRKCVKSAPGYTVP